MTPARARVALGATWPEIRGLILRHAARLAVMGVGAGLAGVVATTGLTRSMVYGVGPLDPLTVDGCSFVLLAVACLGALVPARRAARVDPVLALRPE